MKKLIRLTESDLHRIVSESVKNILKEVRLLGKPTIPPSELKEKINQMFGNAIVNPTKDTSGRFWLTIDTSVVPLGSPEASEKFYNALKEYGYSVVNARTFEEAANINRRFNKPKTWTYIEVSNGGSRFTTPTQPEDSDNQPFRTIDDGDNINLNDPNSGEALRRKYAYTNEYSSSDAMENPWGYGGIARLRALYGGY